MQVDFAKKVEDVFSTMINDAVHERNWT